MNTTQAYCVIHNGKYFAGFGPEPEFEQQWTWCCSKAKKYCDESDAKLQADFFAALTRSNNA